IENLPKPLLPATLVCATKAAALSTSVAAKVPPVLWAASVSVSVAVLAPVITAASLLPWMVTVICWAVPSAVATVWMGSVAGVCPVGGGGGGGVVFGCTAANVGGPENVWRP